MKIAIVNALNEKFIFEIDAPDDTTYEDAYKLIVNAAADARTELRGASLNYADFSGADLSGMDLTEAHLRYANLRGANLTGARLVGATLIDADLTGTDFTGADLRYADLMGANLTDVNMTGAQLDGANLGQTDGHHGPIPAGPLVINPETKKYYRDIRANYPKGAELVTEEPAAE